MEIISTLQRLPDSPLSSEASDLLSRIMPKIQTKLEEVNRIPISVLLWGPGMNSDSPLTIVRTNLRSRLRYFGHAAVFSEEICDPGSNYSIRLQQLAQAQHFDLIVSLPCTPGSIAEIHDFATDRRVFAKLLVFLNDLHVQGYSAQSLEAIRSILSCHIEYYPNEQDTTLIESRTLDEVQRLREMKYMFAGRYI